MNLSEVKWDFEASGTWPWPIKLLCTLVTCALVAGAGVYYFTLDQLSDLEKVEHKEIELRKSFSEKQKKAVNLPDYKSQLEQIEVALQEMIKQLPTEEEVASLLVDISQTGLASGLEFRLFKPGAPVPKDFYSELPINIQVVGRYEELGLFVSGLASLPRIVTVHDVTIEPEQKSSKSKSKGKSKGNSKGKESEKTEVALPGAMMVMDAVVKTYNESLTPVKTKEKKGKKNKRGKKNEPK